MQQHAVLLLPGGSWANDNLLFAMIAKIRAGAWWWWYGGAGLAAPAPEMSLVFRCDANDSHMARFTSVTGAAASSPLLLPPHTHFPTLLSGHAWLG